jgi:hypothetical protein
MIRNDHCVTQSPGHIYIIENPCNLFFYYYYLLSLLLLLCITRTHVFFSPFDQDQYTFYQFFLQVTYTYKFSKFLEVDWIHVNISA